VPSEQQQVVAFEKECNTKAHAQVYFQSFCQIHALQRQAPFDLRADIGISAEAYLKAEAARTALARRFETETGWSYRPPPSFGGRATGLA
jgi:hypothetical protein